MFLSSVVQRLQVQHKSNGINRLKQHMMNRNANNFQLPAGGSSSAVIAGGAAAASGGGLGKVLNLVRSVSAKGGTIGAIVAGIVTAITLSQEYIKWTHSPGGPNDLRYRRVIATEMDPLFERKEKQEINMGIRTVRISGSPATRGETQNPFYIRAG